MGLNLTKYEYPTSNNNLKLNKMTKIEIKSIFGKVLFIYEAENATIKDAVEKAVKEKVSLIYANLRFANLSSADLSSAKNKETAYLPLFCKWSFTVLGNKIQIGCKEKTIEEWDLFFASNKIYSTERGTEYFKQIEAVYLACKAYLTHLSNESK